ncbi:MAG: hypothetical protein QHH17_07640 [Candidatus Bathyarchaeota archaeon]|jgi:uncharacterized membrane protein YczE|nr:hypothetical protein [Candidatus Bathyarchaeota archaeon]
MSKPERKYVQKLVALIGIVLLAMGIGLWLYTESVVRGHEHLLNDPNLTQEQRWECEGSLQWWRTAKKTLYDPLAIILVTIGFCAIEYVIIYLIVRSS